MSEEPICPCETFVHPAVIFNAPGRQVIAYRVGDFITFRHALLLPRPDETELTGWRPGAEGDLAAQMIEWWAYLADVLTFYNERIANQAYLRTADLPESVNRLIRLLGYRPRPGIGATGTLAALVGGVKPITLPQGFQIQSKPGPGKQPQIFEVNAATVLTPPSVVDVEPRAATSLAGDDGSGSAGGAGGGGGGGGTSLTSLLLKGSVGTVKVGDELLLLQSGWDGQDTTKTYALLQVTEVAPEKDPRGATNTRVSVNPTTVTATDQEVKDYQLLKSTQSTYVWQYTTADPDVVIQANQVDLSQLIRQIKAGDVVLFEITGPKTGSLPAPQPVLVTGYTEQIWYANTGTSSDPTQLPATTTPPTPPIPIPHTRLTFQPPISADLTTGWPSHRDVIQLRYAWHPVGQLIPTPATSFSGTPAGGVLPVLAIAAPDATPPAAAPLPVGTGLQVLLEDTNGDGALGTGSVAAGSGQLQLTHLTQLTDTATALVPPLRALFNTLVVSRGKTVPSEVLGSGDATVAGQEFVLQNSPLTYLASGDSASGDQYSSTLRIWVDGVEWKEVPSFYSQSSKAHVFVTREDESQKTHVQFGDGVNGARLPSGVNNVVARYRYGSGAEAPGAGSLTVVIQPQPNLKAIRNPVPVGGGADPDPAAQIKRYAPRSVLTFGRAVSGDDYETIAAQAPGVARARAYWAWDNTQQRTLVTVYVGDDNNAVDSARKALARAADPNRPVQVSLAWAVPIQLTLALRLDSAYQADPVQAAVQTAVRAALLDPDTGLFGVNVIGIGQYLYVSQIEAACLAVPGVLAVHGLVFAWIFSPGHTIALTSRRHYPTDGGFFQLTADNLSLSVEA